ncbi:MAG: hypothetical protein ACHQM7_05825 [Vicinamibacterales bacterium]|jgi:hypothetical protein
MNRLRFVLLVLTTIVLGSGALTAAGENAGTVDHQAAFDRLKSLAGSWKGHHTTPNGPEMGVEYSLTGNGTALTERLFAGTPHEMLSVYYMERGELVLTHYCAMGNQPRMRLVAGGMAGELRFDFVGGANLDAATTTHIHGGRITTPAPDRFDADWFVWTDGKQTDTHRLFMKRVAK